MLRACAGGNPNEMAQPLTSMMPTGGGSLTRTSIEYHTNWLSAVVNVMDPMYVPERDGEAVSCVGTREWCVTSYGTS